jgi:hypothetical protein
MPNWCNNSVIIKGREEDVKEVRKFLKGRGPKYMNDGSFNKKDTCEAAEVDMSEKPSVFQFHKVIPVPFHVLKDGYSEAGYNWQIAHWGTKWEAGDIDLQVTPKQKKGRMELCYNFSTAWSPPEAVILKLGELFPKVHITFTYDESGCCFAGKLIMKGGKTLKNEYVEGAEYEAWYRREFGEEAYQEAYGDNED